MQIRKARDLIRKHLYWLVEELSNAQPGCEVGAFREGDIVWKTYSSRVWNLKNKDAKPTSLSATIQQSHKQENTDNYLGGLYSVPRTGVVGTYAPTR